MSCLKTHLTNESKIAGRSISVCVIEFSQCSTTGGRILNEWPVDTIYLTFYLTMSCLKTHLTNESKIAGRSISVCVIEFSQCSTTGGRILNEWPVDTIYLTFYLTMSCLKMHLTSESKIAGRSISVCVKEFSQCSTTGVSDCRILNEWPVDTIYLTFYLTMSCLKMHLTSESEIAGRSISVCDRIEPVLHNWCNKGRCRVINNFY